jgi:hypothetical protein
MKVLILTGHFFPEIHPRSFRSNELACELSRKGHDVNVVSLRTIKSFDYAAYEKDNKIRINKLGLYNTELSATIENKKGNSFVIAAIRRKFRFLVDYFFGGNLIFYSRKIQKKLSFSADYDLVIALSTPFMNLLGVALSKKNLKKNKTIFVADSGDPFYRSQQTRRAPYFYFLERFVYSHFDYLTIPDIAAKVAYYGLIESNKIKIIPQGFRMDNYVLPEFLTSDVISFAYCGVFYLDIRNPRFLLERLLELKIPFRFDIYLREKTPAVTLLLKRYEILLGEKLNISYGLTRENMLAKLGEVDFLVNIENLTSTQIPSKLIDYSITKKPIFSCKASSFSEDVFDKFLNRDYSDSLNINSERFNIKLVADQFLDLVNPV